MSVASPPSVFSSRECPSSWLESSSSSKTTTKRIGVEGVLRNILKFRLKKQKRSAANKKQQRRACDRVAFAVDRSGRASDDCVYSYEAPLEVEKQLLFFTDEELAQMSEACESLAKENKENKEYLSNLGRIVLCHENNNSNSDINNSISEDVPIAEPLSESSLASSFSTLNASSVFLPESEALEHMRGLEYLLEEKVGAQRRSWVRNIVRYQNKLTRSLVSKEDQEELISRKSMKYSQDSASLALKLAEWDALEAARVHLEDGSG